MNREFVSLMGDLTPESLYYGSGDDSSGYAMSSFPELDPLKATLLRLDAISAQLNYSNGEVNTNDIVGVGIDSIGGNHSALEMAQGYIESKRLIGSRIVYFAHSDVRSAAAKVLSYSPGVLHCQASTEFLWHNIQTDGPDEEFATEKQAPLSMHNRLELLSLCAFLDNRAPEGDSDDYVTEAVRALSPDDFHVVYQQVLKALETIRGTQNTLEIAHAITGFVEQPELLLDAHGRFELKGNDMNAFENVTVHQSVSELREAYEEEGFPLEPIRRSLWNVFCNFASLKQESLRRGVLLDYNVNPANGFPGLSCDPSHAPQIQDLIQKYLSFGNQ